MIRRHRRARDATRAGLRALGLAPYVGDDAQAASVATVALLPAGVVPSALLSAAAHAAAHAAGNDARSGAGLIAGPAFGELAGRAVRVNHTGADAALAPVLTTLACLGAALHALGQPADVTGAVGAAAQTWSAPAGE